MENVCHNSWRISLSPQPTELYHANAIGVQLHYCRAQGIMEFHVQLAEELIKRIREFRNFSLMDSMKWGIKFNLGRKELVRDVICKLC